MNISSFIALFYTGVPCLFSGLLGHCSHHLNSQTLFLVIMECIIYERLAQAQKLVAFAEALGEKEVIILFSKHDTGNKDVLLAVKNGMKLKTGILVKNTKDAMKYSQHYDVLLGEATRDLLENKQVTHIYNAEMLEGKDKTHRRGSGINQVSAKLIKDKDKTYVYNLSLLLSAKNQPEILGRMQQNKRILGKYGCAQDCWSLGKTVLELRAPKERKHFLQEL